MLKKKKSGSSKPPSFKGNRWSNSRKKLYNGIIFQSGLELYMYKALKKAGIDFSYEGKSYTLIEASEYKGECFERFTKKSKQMKIRKKVRLSIYTPDFIGVNERWIIETKGFVIEPFPIKWKMFKQLLSKRRNPPILLMPKNQKDCDQAVDLLVERGFGGKDKGANLLYINIKSKETNGRRRN